MRNVQTARKKERQRSSAQIPAKHCSSPIPPLRRTRSISHLGASVIWIKYASAVPSCHQLLHLQLGAGHGAGKFWTAWVIKVNYIFHGSHQFFPFSPSLYFLFTTLYELRLIFIIIYIWDVLGLCRFFHSINLPVDLWAGDGQPAGVFPLCFWNLFTWKSEQTVCGMWHHRRVNTEAGR